MLLLLCSRASISALDEGQGRGSWARSFPWTPFPIPDLGVSGECGCFQQGEHKTAGSEVAQGDPAPPSLLWASLLLSGTHERGHWLARSLQSRTFDRTVGGEVGLWTPFSYVSFWGNQEAPSVLLPCSSPRWRWGWRLVSFFSPWFYFTRMRFKGWPLNFPITICNCVHEILIWVNKQVPQAG